MGIPADTIVIADKNQVTRSVLKKTFPPGKFRVVYFKNLQDLRAEAHLATPSVMILGDAHGVAFLHQLRANGWHHPVIFLHSHGSVGEAVQAIRAGAADYLAKPFCLESLINTVSSCLTQNRQQLETERSDQQIRAQVATLTPREIKIVSLVLGGFLNKQIAAQLGLALITVKVHRRKAMIKLGVKTAGELARIAPELGRPGTSEMISTPLTPILPNLPARYESEKAAA